MWNIKILRSKLELYLFWIFHNFCINFPYRLNLYIASIVSFWINYVWCTPPSSWSLQWHHDERDKITSVAIVCSTIYSGADQRKHQTSASLAFVRGIHRWPVNSPHKVPVTRKMLPFDNVIMLYNKDERVEAIRLFSLSCCRRTVTRCFIFGKQPGLLPSLASMSVLGIIFT